MSGRTAGLVPRFGDASDYLRARDVLLGANYSEEGLRRMLGDVDPSSLQEVDTPLILRRAQTGTTLETLARLFLLGVSVDTAAARRAVFPMPLERWVKANLVRLRGGQVAPLVRLVPYQGLVLAADVPARLRSGAARDSVLGVAKSSMLLARSVISRRTLRTLDLGTGCGILALLASRHSDEVYATDKNPRAIAFSQFNARFNGVGKVRWLSGE